jgi:hypothetical protein
LYHSEKIEGDTAVLDLGDGVGLSEGKGALEGLSAGTMLGNSALAFMTAARDSLVTSVSA